MTYDVRYSPGPWLALGGGTTWLLVESQPESALLDAVWPPVRDGAPLLSLLSALVSAAGPVTPAFCCVRWDGDGLRVVVRGSGRVDVDGRGTAAGDRATWLEEHVPTAREVRLVAGDHPAGPDIGLPWSAGVTMAASITVCPARDQTPIAAETTVAAQVSAAPPVTPVDRLEAGETMEGLDLDQADDTADEQTASSPEPLVPQPSGSHDAAAAERPRGKYDVMMEDSQRPDEQLIAERLGERDSSVMTGPTASAGSDPDGPQPDVPASAVPPSLVPQEPVVLAAPDVPAVAPHPPAARIGGLIDAVPNFDDGPRQLPPAAVPLPAPVRPQAPAVRGSGSLRLVTGDTVPLDKLVIVGRVPTPPAGADLAHVHLIRILEPDISGTHVTFSPEAGHVVVTDVSRNGTWVVQPGREAERLRKDEPVPLPPGSQVYLNEKLYLIYEAQ